MGCSELQVIGPPAFGLLQRRQVLMSQHAKEQGFAVGDYVVSNGYHAEVVSVPATCALKLKMPTTVKNTASLFLGAIAMQGIRLTETRIGETVLVYGAEGLIIVDILLASGAKVITADVSDKALDLAAEKCFATINFLAKQSVEDEVKAHSQVDMEWTPVLITASSPDNSIISNSAKASRQRRIVLIEVVGLSINRADFTREGIVFSGFLSSTVQERYDDAYGS